ncbi:MAG: hypothetical protein Q4D55_07180 [Eubacteriales bacterium]|nr:hypothetical protein [Eubacteriales bacterium]
MRPLKVSEMSQASWVFMTEPVRTITEKVTRKEKLIRELELMVSASACCRSQGKGAFENGDKRRRRVRQGQFQFSCPDCFSFFMK